MKTIALPSVAQISYWAWPVFSLGVGLVLFGTFVFQDSLLSGGGWLWQIVRNLSSAFI